MKGGMVCAASPASSTRPARIVLASRPRNSYTVCRTSTPSAGVNHGASSSQTRASSAKSSAHSPGSSMNSKRRCRRPLRECMCGRSGIAPLARRRQPGERLHVVRPDVDDEPALREALVVEGDAGRLADERVRAVRADHVAGAHPLLALVAHGQGDVVAGLLERLHVPALVDAGGGQGADGAVERPLEARLVEEVAGRPPGGADVRMLEPQDRLAVRAQPLVGVHRQQVVRDLVHDAERLPDLLDLVVEVERPRQVVQVRHGARRRRRNGRVPRAARSASDRRARSRRSRRRRRRNRSASPSPLRRRAPGRRRPPGRPGFSMAPIPSTSTRTRSPGFSHGWPSRIAAIPDGVPVAITSPGSRCTPGRGSRPGGSSRRSAAGCWTAAAALRSRRCGCRARADRRARRR